MNPLHTTVSLKICASPEEATKEGYVYQEPEYKAIEIKEVVIVRGGTVEGNATSDFILQDATGQKHVFFITNNLLRMITNLGGGN